MVSVIIFLCVWMCERAGVGLCLSCSLRGHPVLQRQRKQSASTGAVWWTYLQWGGKFNQSVDRWDSMIMLVMIPRHSISIQSFKNTFFLQVLCRRTSATMCLAVWRRSSLSVALATETAVTMESQFVGQMGSSTRTSVRWRCLPVEMGHASSRFRYPSVLTVSALSQYINWTSALQQLGSIHWLQTYISNLSNNRSAS